MGEPPIPPSPFDAGLSRRELEVLELMAEGLTNEAIGVRLGLGERTVESVVRSIFTRLGLHETASENRRVVAVRRYLDACYAMRRTHTG